MRCPSCGQHTPDAWKFLETGRNASGALVELQAPQAHAEAVFVDWMRCANAACEELVIRIHETYRTSRGGIPIEMTTSSWIARPRGGHRPVDPAVPDRFRLDYQEAVQILDISPRMSAVLSRRILADLLETYAKQDGYKITERIDNFMSDTSHPFELRKTLHYLREIADFSAHTQTNDQAQVVDVSRDEAEWTLDIVERFFDYFIVTPGKDLEIMEAMDQKLKETNRRAIPPLPDEPTEGK